MNSEVEQKNILILGGYGNTGRPLARLLLQESNAQLVIGGRNAEKASLFADELNRAFEGNRVCGACVDASDLASLRNACEHIDFVIVASSTAQFINLITQAVLDNRIGYLDIQVSSQKISYLRSMESAIQQAGCCFITDGGFHPGLPAFLVRYAAQFFDQLEIARVGSVIKEDWKSLDVEISTVYELVELMTDFDMSTYKGGKWRKANLYSTSDFVKMDFGAEFGKQYCAPMLLEEMRDLPRLFPTLTETGFYVGSFNWFVDWVISPIAMVGMKLSPHLALKPMASLMHWGLKTFSKPPYGTLLRLEATGMKSGQSKTMQVTISHPDGYLFTALPVVACMLQYLDGSIAAPGLWLQATVVEPDRFMRDMQRMGITVQTSDGG
jgi:saccharopine dehydrogenase-like NADP-dependent oxidoreductase